MSEWCQRCGFLCTCPKTASAVTAAKRATYFESSGPARAVPYLLGFRQHSRDERVEWTARPVAMFRMKGLMVWGATDESRILRTRVGVQEVLRYGQEPVPARFFEAGMSFEEIIDRLKNIELQTRLKEPLAPGAPPDVFQSFLSRTPLTADRQQLRPPTCIAGEAIIIETSGPLTALVVWGLGIE